MASAGDSFAPTIPLTRAPSFTRTRSEELQELRYDRDINGQDDRWEGNLDEALTGKVLQRPRRKSTVTKVEVIPEDQVGEREEWELADEVWSWASICKQNPHLSASPPPPKGPTIPPAPH